MNLSFKLKNRKFIPAAFFLFGILCWYSCKKDTDNPSTGAITSFALMKDSVTTIQATAVFKGDSILVTVPATTNLTALDTKIVLASGASVSPASGVVENFTQPVSYTVTTANGTNKTYIVKVTPDKLKNILYIGTGGGAIFALNASNGAQLWVQSPGGDFSYSSPAFSNNVIYAGNTDGKMYACNAATGDLIWKYQTGSSIESSPAVSGGNVYFGSDDHNFYAVNAVTGALTWKYNTTGNVSSSPVVYNGVVYFGSDDGNVYAFDANSGTMMWRFYAGSMINAASPAQLNGVIYIGDRDGNFFALDASTGEQKWKFSSGGLSFEMSRPVIVNGIIYVTSWYNVSDFRFAGAVYALDAVTGQQNWINLPYTGFSSGVAADAGELFVSADDMNFYALDQKNGSIIWSNKILPNGALPTAKSGTVYVAGSGTGYFYAFDESKGNVKWQVKINGLSHSKPYLIDANGN